ncbi:MAG: helix-turn-helix domain-containing protein [Edaphobacter sp.]|uniref:winged helix-turn-helix transcriptional regulator n=1 Tax=Edaphobacter sp. TaxID=1934404 RepID=UPI0023A5DB4F|nr:helix-turn-helix domain-containing protein [Edaphobacter sp.]MDE1176688.1 helix-turn-helix domain-containing protein [Edaphobacter sp.]
MARRTPISSITSNVHPITGDVYQGTCPTRTVLDHITARWSMLILRLLLDRKRRFSELRRLIGGVSEKMLAQSLRALEEDGFVERTVFPTKPPSVEYSLTPLGSEMAPHVYALTAWVENNLATVLAHREGRKAQRAS